MSGENGAGPAGAEEVPAEVAAALGALRRSVLLLSGAVLVAELVGQLLLASGRSTAALAAAAVGGLLLLIALPVLRRRRRAVLAARAAVPEPGQVPGQVSERTG
ncbi:hypothetical protein WN990_00065 [Kitasatospora purpeofusca]|uniref:hypothetical protein n=1 Tax=Kitasatospora purpeofusca TaxID=67352 RepID=UPI0030F0D1B3